jgi:hypothetical protein
MALFQSDFFFCMETKQLKLFRSSGDFGLFEELVQGYAKLISNPLVNIGSVSFFDRFFVFVFLIFYFMKKCWYKQI